MLLQQLYLSNFRCFQNRTFSFHPQITSIIGPNAQGKTSILEGIMAGFYGRGFRESREFELVKYYEDVSVVSVDMTANDKKIVFTSQIKKSGRNRVAKQYLINKSKVTFKNYRTHGAHAVLFAPQHINIITGSPTRRREYVDSVIAADSVEYAKRLRNYQNALHKRNKILEMWSDELSLIRELQFWDDYLIEQSAFITEKRKQFVNYLNTHQPIENKHYHVEYLSNQFTHSQLQKYRSIEFRTRHTMIGPQKDEFKVFLKGEISEDVQLYGSRSQQRMAVFWLKLNELQYLEDTSKTKPILLLDDIFSELDRANRRLALNMVVSYQTVVTTTEDEIEEMLPIEGGEIRLSGAQEHHVW